MTDTATSAPGAATTEPPLHRLFIGGEWLDATTGRTFDSVNPADTREVVGRFQAASAADVARAVAAADAAFAGWRATPAPKRGEVLYRFGALMAEHKERLARAMTREMGKVLAEARGDVQEGIDIAFLMAGEGRRMFGDTTPSELPDKWAMSVREPLGVAGIITPWNFPMAIPCWKMMPALVTGNTVVFKPSSDTPLCATLLVELMAEAGFPAGTVNLVTGPGAEVGDALVTNPDVPVISFTGNTATGRRIAELAAPPAEAGQPRARRQERDRRAAPTPTSTWRPTGSSGRPSGRPASAARPARGSSSRRRSSSRCSSGCDDAGASAPPRLRSRADDRCRPAGQRGRASTRSRSYVEIGRREGELVTGGERASGTGLEHGHFFEPTIFGGVKPMDRIAQEEIFGPVLSVIAVPDYPAAVTALNQTRYGLSSSIFTRDVNMAFRAMRDFETGIVYVNAGTIGAETHLPFGGIKETGNGHREAGHAALETYTEWKSIYVDFSGRLQKAQIDNQPG